MAQPRPRVQFVGRVEPRTEEGTATETLRSYRMQASRPDAIKSRNDFARLGRGSSLALCARARMLFPIRPNTHNICSSLFDPVSESQSPKACEIRSAGLSIAQNVNVRNISVITTYVTSHYHNGSAFTPCPAAAANSPVWAQFDPIRPSNCSGPPKPRQSAASNVLLTFFNVICC